jgi:uncharacterized phage-associated protein
MLVKLVYFAELESWARRGEPLTGTPFRLYHYGAYAPEVHFEAEAMPELVAHKRLPGFDWPEHKYSLQEGAAPPHIDPAAEAIVAEVCKRYARMTAAAIGALSKQTQPVLNAVEGKRLDLSVVAPRRPGVRVSNRKLLDAAARLDTSVRSTDDRDELEREEIAAFAAARKRASANLDTTP